MSKAYFDKNNKKNQNKTQTTSTKATSSNKASSTSASNNVSKQSASKTSNIFNPTSVDFDPVAYRNRNRQTQNYPANNQTNLDIRTATNNRGNLPTESEYTPEDYRRALQIGKKKIQAALYTGNYNPKDRGYYSTREHRIINPIMESGNETHAGNDRVTADNTKKVTARGLMANYESPDAAMLNQYGEFAKYVTEMRNRENTRRTSTQLLDSAKTNVSSANSEAQKLARDYKAASDEYEGYVQAMRTAPNNIFTQIQMTKAADNMNKAKKALADAGYSEVDVDALLSDTSRVVNAENRERQQKEIAKSGAVGKAVANVTDVLTFPEASASSFAGSILGGENADYNSNAFRLGNMSRDIETQTMQDITNKFGREVVDENGNKYNEDILASKAVGTIYQAAMSTGKMLTLNGLAAGMGAALGVEMTSNIASAITLPSYGMSAFSDTMQNAQERGLDYDKAIALSTVAALGEIGTEVLPQGHFWDMAKGNGSRLAGNFIIDMFVQAGLEGIEEIESQGIYDAADYVINAKDSEFNVSVQQYLAALQPDIDSGKLSQEEAYKKALEAAKWDKFYEYVNAFAAGAVGGLMGGGGANGINYIASSKAGRNIVSNTANTNVAIEMTPDLKDQILQARGKQQGGQLKGKEARELYNSFTDNLNAQAEAKAQADADTISNTTDAAAFIKAKESAEDNGTANTETVKAAIAEGEKKFSKETREAVVTEKIAKEVAFKGKEFSESQKEYVKAQPEEVQKAIEQAQTAGTNLRVLNAIEKQTGNKKQSLHLASLMRTSADLGVSFDTFVESNKGLVNSLTNDLGALETQYNVLRGEAINSDSAKAAPSRVLGSGVLNFDNAKGHTVDAKQQAFLQAFANKTKVNFDLYYDEDTNTRGSYSPENGSISINLAHSSDVFEVAMHEGIGEFLQAHNQKAYNEIANAVLDWAYAKDSTALSNTVSSYKAAYIASGEKDKSTRAAANEFVNDNLGKIFATDEGIQEFANWLNKNEKKSVLEKIIDFINDMKAMINDAIKNGGLKKSEKLALEDDIATAEKIRQAILNAMDETISSKSEIEATGYTVDTQTATVSRNSVRTTIANTWKDLKYNSYEEAKESISKSIAKNIGVSEEKAARWIESEESLAAIILGSEENTMYLDYEPDDRYGAIKKNSDYPQGTVDASNLCRKRTIFTTLFDNLQKKYPNKLFTADDIAKIRQIMVRPENNLEVACALCYVEDRRQKVGEIADTFIGFYKKALDSESKQVLKQNNAGAWKPLQVSKDNQAKYGVEADIYATDPYVPNQYDLTTYEGFKNLMKEHPVVAIAFETYNNSRGMQSARLVEGHAEYKREILKYSPAQVERINNLGGLRIFSFSDFEAIHMIDIVQVIEDCAAVGLKVQCYTKVPSYSELVRNTGIKQNRSLIPSTATTKKSYIVKDGKFIAVKADDRGIATVDGKEYLAFDVVEGIDITNKHFTDESNNPNVGNVLIGVNNDQIELAMNDAFVDYIIPFHTGQATEVLHTKGIGSWTNYKDFQEDKKTSEWVKGDKERINIYEDIINNSKYDVKTKVDFVNAFINECKENHLKPRFSQFLNRNGSEYTYREGYHKFLVDYKLFDNNGNILPQEVVRPDFDEKLMNDILMEEKERTKNSQFSESVMKQVEDEVINVTPRNSLVINQTIDNNEKKYIEKELLALKKHNEHTTFKTKDDKIGVRNNRSIYIVDDFDDVDSFDLLRVYDFSVAELDSTETAILMKGVELYEQGKAGTKLTVEQYVSSCIYLRGTNLQAGDNVRIYGYQNGGRNTELKLGKTGRVLSTTNTNTRLKNVGEPSSSQRTAYNRNSINVDSYAPTFYSKMEREIENIKSNKIGASSVISYLTGKGVKAEEIKWSGIETFLEGKKSVTKEELLSFVTENNLQIEETVLGGDSAETRFVDPEDSSFTYNWDELEENARLYAEANDLTYSINDWEGERDYVTITYYDSNGEYDDEVDLYKSGGLTRWQDYITEGAENYREILFKLPNSEYTNNAMQVHWGEKGVLAHARIDDIELPNGDKMLFVEEIQSDWHNAGSKNGYKGKSKGRFIAVENDGSYDMSPSIKYGVLDTKTNKIIGGANSLENAQDEVLRQENIEDKSAAADAPFKNTYTDFVMKRLLREAAEKGYDYIGWTTGKMQEERWSSEYAEGYHIEYDQDIPKFMNKYGKPWGAKVENVGIGNLSEYFDKSSAYSYAITNGIVESSEDIEDVYSNLDGTYTVEHYDSKGTLQSTIMAAPSANTPEYMVHAVKITPEMKQSVLYEGQPRYSIKVLGDESPYAEAYQQQEVVTNVMAKIDKNELQKKKLKIKSIKSIMSRMMGTYNLSFGASYIKELEEDLVQFDKYMKSDDVSYNQTMDYLMQIADTIRERAHYFKGGTTLDNDLVIAMDLLDTYYELNNIDSKVDARQELKKETRKYEKQLVDTFNSDVEEIKSQLMAKEAVAKVNNKFGKNEPVPENIDIQRMAEEIAAKRYEDIKYTAEKAKQRDKITRTCTRLINWMNKETDKKHVPAFMKNELAELISQIDFMPESLRVLDYLKDSVDTKSANKWRDSMIKLANVLSSVESSEAGGQDADSRLKYQMSIVLEAGSLMQDMQDLIDSTNGNVRVSKLSNENLKKLSQIMDKLSHAIDKLNETYRNATFEKMDELGDATISELSTLKQRTNRSKNILKRETLHNFLNIEMLEPISFFEEMGNASASIMQEFFDGEQKGIDIVRESEEFFDNLHNELEVNEKMTKKWKNEIHEFNVRGGSIVLTTSDIMSLYASNKREEYDQAKHPETATMHIAAGGIKGFKRSIGIESINMNPKTVHPTYAQLNEIIDTLSDTQKEYVDKVVEFMSKVLSKYGNEVSMEMYGYNKFGTGYYFPLKTDTNALSKNEGNSETKQVALRSLINQSFTKSQLDRADNALVCKDFFDVVTEHIMGMSNYCAYAMPVADTLRWYDYSNVIRQEIEGEEDRYDRIDSSVAEAIKSARGDKATAYLEKFLRNVNMDNRNDGSEIQGKLMGLYKAQAVGANLRVVLQQPAAIFRAEDVIEKKYLVAGVAKAIATKNAMKIAQAENNLCYWKSKGFSDTRISQNMQEIIVGNKTIIQDIVELSGALAGIADDVTWTSMYFAARAKVEATTDLKEGTEEYKKAVDNIFSDIVNHTQVIDSMLRQTGEMRKTDNLSKIANAFKKEPQKTYNMLHRKINDIIQADGKEKMAIAQKAFGKTLAIYIETALVTAIAQSIADAWRDDDDDKYIDKFLNALLPTDSIATVKNAMEAGKLTPMSLIDIYSGSGNFIDNLNPFNLMPYFSDLDSALKGFKSTRMDTQIFQEIVDTAKVFSQESTAYKKSYSSAKLISAFTGIGLSNAIREVKSLWNNVLADKLGKKKWYTTKTAEDAAEKNKYTKPVEEAFESGDNAAIKESVKGYYDYKYSGYIADGKTEDEAAQAAKEATSNYITTEYKQQLIDLYSTDKSAAQALKQKMIQAYTSVGYDAEQKNKVINKWFE